MRRGARGAGRRPRAVAAVLAVAGAAVVGGCGSEAHDLFLVQRAGTVPGAGLALRITDDGRASCNRGPLVGITSGQLIDAREIARDLEPLALRGVSLGAQPGSVLRYRVALPDGSVRFADSSRGQPPAFFRLAKLTRDVARSACKLAR